MATSPISGAGDSQGLRLYNLIYSLISTETVKIADKYRDRVIDVKNMFRNDVSGLAGTLADFMIKSASIDFTIESNNETLKDVLNDWKDNINDSILHGLSLFVGNQDVSGYISGHANALLAHVHQCSPSIIKSGNSFQIPSQTLNIPLMLPMSRFSHHTLPLLRLKNHFVKVCIKLNPLDKLTQNYHFFDDNLSLMASKFAQIPNITLVAEHVMIPE